MPKGRKQPKCPQEDKWINEIWHGHNGILFSLNRKTVSDTCCNTDEFEEFMLSDMLTTKGQIQFYLYEIPRTGKIHRDRKERLQGAGQESGELLLQEHRASSVLLPSV